MDDTAQQLLAFRGTMRELENELETFISCLGTRTHHSVPNSTRMLTEKILMRACSQRGLPVPVHPNIEGMKSRLQSHGVPRRIVSHLCHVQNLGNAGSHAQLDGNELTEGDVLSLLYSALQVVQWYQTTSEASDTAAWRSVIKTFPAHAGVDRQERYQRLCALGPSAPPPFWVLEAAGVAFDPSDAMPPLREALKLEGVSPSAPGPSEVRSETRRGFQLAGDDGKAIAVLHNDGPFFGKTFVVRRGIGLYYQCKAGGPTGWLGFPKSNEYRNTEGTRSDFEHGYVQYSFESKAAVAYKGHDDEATPFADVLFRPLFRERKR